MYFIFKKKKNYNGYLYWRSAFRPRSMIPPRLDVGLRTPFSMWDKEGIRETLVAQVTWPLGRQTRCHWSWGKGFEFGVYWRDFLVESYYKWRDIPVCGLEWFGRTCSSTLGVHWNSEWTTDTRDRVDRTACGVGLGGRVPWKKETTSGLVRASWSTRWRECRDGV